MSGPRAYEHRVSSAPFIKRVGIGYDYLFMALGMPSKKAGQPHPLENLVVDLYRGVPQPTLHQSGLMYTY